MQKDNSRMKPWNNICIIYRIAGFFRGPIFSRIANGSEFCEKYFRKTDHTHVGALREEDVAPKISRNIFSRLGEIREICENKCPRKNPAIRYIA